MRTVFLPVLLGLSLSTLSLPLRAQGADAILGGWLTDKDESRIEIAKCGDTFCGKITWLKEPLYDAKDAEPGKVKHDRENPDSKLRARPIIGLALLSGFKHAGGTKWDDGTIYDPESGKTYQCVMNLAPDGKVLNVRGFIKVPFLGSAIGRTTAWRRAPAVLPAEDAAKPVEPVKPVEAPKPAEAAPAK